MFTVKLGEHNQFIYTRIASGGGGILFDREVWKSDNNTVIFNYGFTQLTNLYGMAHGVALFDDMRESLMYGELHKNNQKAYSLPLEITADDVVLCTMHLSNFYIATQLYAFLADIGKDDSHVLNKQPVHPMLQREYPEPIRVHVELHK